MSVPVTLIAAVAQNGVIGARGGMPWRVPSDMAFFRRRTMGKPIVMGRKQFESVGKPLPGRVNIVVTRRQSYQPEGVLVIPDVSAALDQARGLAAAVGAAEVMVIGGGQIYAASLPLADRLVLSEIALTPDGDTLFPAFDRSAWTIVDQPEVTADPRDEAPFTVTVFERRVPLARR